MNQRWFINILLFLLTIGTTFLIGLGEGIVPAVMYSGALMSILLFHEMGHYLMSRKYGVPCTLPFFIPVPLPPFGTMGAFIRIKGHIPDKHALFDIGVAGPLAGLAVIIPVIFIGVKLSRVEDLKNLGEGVFSLGDSILFNGIMRLSIGKIQEGKELVLHPLAYAGWVGLLVTAMNLLPVGQLDGGHIIYAMFGRHSRWISRIVYAALVIVFLFKSVMWFVWLILLAIFHRHPPTFNDQIRLDDKRIFIGYFALIVFILSFTPAPFTEIEGFIPLAIKTVERVMPLIVNFVERLI